jgi:type VI secretion system protein ImpL
MKKNFLDPTEGANLLLIVLLSIIIWFADFFSRNSHFHTLFSVKFKIIFIGLLFVFWLIRLIILKIINFYASQKIVGALLQNSNSETAKKNSSVNKKELRKKISIILKAIKRVGGKEFLGFANLPWYVVLGKEGAGKTAAMQGAALTRPDLDDKTCQIIQQLQQESAYSWWFTNEGVFLEVTLSVEHKAVYMPLFDVLRKYRQGKPVDGIIYVKDISSFNEANETALDEEFALVQDVMARIQKKLLVPCHLLFTKCDQIEGFFEYFKNLSRKDAKKTLGFHVESHHEEAVLYKFDNQFHNMFLGLQRCLPILFEKKDLMERIAANNFPNQLAALKKQFGRFISSFAHNMQSDPFFFLQGVYFSSALQDNPSINLYPSYLKDQFNMDSHLASHPSSKESVPYFLEDFFKIHILLASLQKPKYDKFWCWKRSKFLFFCTLYALSLIFYVGYAHTTYKKVKLYIQDVSKALDSYKSVKSKTYEDNLLNVKPIFKLLNKTQEIYENYLGWQQAMSSLAGYSVYEAHQTIQETFVQVFDQKFWRLVFKHIEDVLRQENDPEKIEFFLRCYIFFSDPAHFSQENLRSFIHEEISFHHAMSRSIKLKKYFDFALARTIPSFALDLALIREKQAQINALPPHIHAYQELKKQAQQLTLVYYYPIAEPLLLHFVFVHKHNQDDWFPYFYTEKGFTEFVTPQVPKIVKRIADENKAISLIDHTLFSIFDEEHVENDLWKEYFSDYLNTWADFVDNLAFVSVNTRQEAEDLLKRILQKGSLFQKLLDVLGPQLAVVPESFQGHPEFIRLQKIVQLNMGTKDTAPKIQEFLVNIQKVQELLTSFAKQDNPNKAMFDYALLFLKDLKDDPLRHMGYSAQDLPSPLNEWFFNLKQQIENIIFQGAGHFIDERWQEEVVPDYNEKIAPFYPIQKQGSQDLKMEMLTKFFGPKGLWGNFYKTYIEPFWVVHKFSSLGFAKGIDGFIKNLCDFSSEFFSDTNQINLTLRLAPYSLDDTLSAMSLSIFGQKISYYHGPLQFLTIPWAAPGDCVITVSDFEGNVQTQNFQGPWGVFRLLDQYPLVWVEDGFLQTITFEKEGHVVAQILFAHNKIQQFLNNLRNTHLPKGLVE